MNCVNFGLYLSWLG